MALQDKSQKIFEDIVTFDGIRDEDDQVVPLYDGKRFRLNDKARMLQFYKTPRHAKKALWNRFNKVVESYYKQEMDDYQKELLLFRFRTFLKEKITFMTVKEWRERHDH